MKIRSLFWFLFIFLLSSCKQVANDAKILSVSIEPQKYFLEKIVGDKYTVNTLIQAGANPETADPSPSQMVALSKSIAYFKVGHLSFENVWANNLKENSPNVHIFNCSDGIEVIEGHNCEEHHNDHEHSHGHEGADPHIWSSVIASRKMADNMYKAVVSLDKENEAYYTLNYNRLTLELDSIDKVIKHTLAKSTNRSFIIYHPALTYFANEYNLNQYTIEQDGKSPSPVQLKNLIDTARAKGVKIVFVQAEYDTKNAETIAKEIGAKIVSINLLSYNWDEEMIKIANAIGNQQ